jgi:GR25 family glycosyltransferase involved in LPS biosynthesis
MKYTILTLNDPRREKHRKRIRHNMRGLEEVTMMCVDGSDEEVLNATIDHYGFTAQFDEWRPGEGGVWYSNINVWDWAARKNEHIVVFEDDAVLSDQFGEVVKNIELPPDYDFITWYIPYAQTNTIMPVRLVPTYQEHGMVCMQYSPTGASKIMDMLATEGLEWPVDIWLFKKALAGELNGYSPGQFCRRLVRHDFDIPTSIHENERIAVHKPDFERSK